MAFDCRRGDTVNVADKAAVAHVHAEGTYTNHVIGRSDIQASITAQSSIVRAGGVVLERTSPVGRVLVTGGVAIERNVTGSRVTGAGIIEECTIS